MSWKQTFGGRVSALVFALFMRALLAPAARMAVVRSLSRRRSPDVQTPLFRQWVFGSGGRWPFRLYTYTETL